MKNCSSDNKKTNWKSIYIATIISFVGTVQYNLFFSALWPYLETLDKTATEDFFGYIIAIYSVGQMIMSPIFGYWSNKIKQVKLPLFVGIILMIAGNIIYLSMTAIPFSSKYVLFFGRFITGAGSSNSAVLRTYASTASTSNDRSKAIGFISCGQALGAVMGPGFQLAFSPLGYPGFGFVDHLRFNLFTAPAYFAIAINIIGIVILFCCFQEHYAGLIEKEENPEPSKTESQPLENLPAFDMIAVAVCLLTRFTFMFFMSNLETVGSAFSMIMFNFSKTKAVKFVAAAQSGVGALTLVTYIAYMFFHLEKHIDPRKICITSIGAFLAFYLLTYSWPFIPGNVSLQNNANDTGCDAEKFSWCRSLAPINVYLYYTAYVVVIGFAYSLINVTVTTLYSKILGPRRQGVTQGIFEIAGGCARLTGPLALSILYTAYGPRITWKVEMVVIGITIIAWLLFYRKMVPLKYGSNNGDHGGRNDIKSKKENKHASAQPANPVYSKVPKFEDMLISMDKFNYAIK